MKVSSIIFQTARLSLREFTISDAPFILQLVNSAGWLKYIGDRNIKTIEQAEAYLANGPIKSYSENGFGLWLAELESMPIGMCGILKRETLEHPDIGFAFMPEFSGNGYACEAAAATLAFAQKYLKIHKLNAITVPANARSIKILEKIGMKKTGELQLNDETLLLYSNECF